MRKMTKIIVVLLAFTLCALFVACENGGGAATNPLAPKRVEVASEAPSNDSTIFPTQINPSQGGASGKYVPRIIDLDGNMNLNDESFDDSVKYDYTPEKVNFVCVNGNMSHEDGAGFGSYVAGDVGSFVVTDKNSAPFPYGTFSVDLKTIPGTDNGLVFGLSTDLDNFLEGRGVSYYYFFLNIEGYAYLGKSDNGVWSELRAVKYNFDAEEYQNLKVVFQGKKICCFVNNTLLFAVRDENVLDGTRFGLLAKGVGAAYKNVAITSDYVLR